MQAQEFQQPETPYPLAQQPTYMPQPPQQKAYVPPQTQQPTEPYAQQTYMSQPLQQSITMPQPAQQPVEQYVQQAYTPQPAQKDKRLNIVAIIWCWICLVANLAAFGILLGFAVATMSEDPLTVLSIVTSLITAIGFIILLPGRKEGLVFMNIGAAANLVLGIIQGNLIVIIAAAFFILITWFVVIPSWKNLNQPGVKHKSKKVAIVLAALPWTGFFGIDRFYLGHIWMGLLKFITGGGLLILYIMDIVRINNGTMKDKYNRSLV